MKKHGYIEMNSKVHASNHLKKKMEKNKKHCSIKLVTTNGSKHFLVSEPNYSKTKIYFS